MNLAYVMDELGDALEFIEGLRVFRWPTEAPVPPAAIVTFPDEYDFDTTYGRGTDRLIVPIIVIVGRATDRAARDQLARYCEGSGDYSIKRAIESHVYDSLDTVRVQRAEFDAFPMSNVQMLAATFDVDVVGTGTTT